jgi:UDP-3-O-[3-hydroxymyristoyl] N-acetylglucosamine deacetylase
VVGDDGVLNREGLRSRDEFVRHKALDVVGDMFLAGFYLDGHITATRPGHGVNNKLLRALFADRANWRLVRETAPAHQPVAAAETYAFA